jgi:hypothetical protein
MPFALSRSTMHHRYMLKTFGRAVAAMQPTQIANIQDELDHHSPPGFTTGATLARLAGARTVLAVPMLKEAELIGAIYFVSSSD